MPGIIAGSILVFVPAVGEFVIPQLLGGTGVFLVGQLIWNQFQSSVGSWSFGSSISIIVVALVLALLMLYVKYAAARSGDDNMRKIGDKLFILYAFVIFAFLFIPIVAMVLFSFNDSRLTAEWHGFTTKWYYVLLGKSGIWTAFYNSVLVALVVTILSALLGTATAMAISHYDFRGKSAFEGYLYVPIIIPEITEALSILLLYMWVRIPLSLLTVVLGHLTFTVPFAAIVIRSRLAGYDRSYEEARTKPRS